MRLAQKFIFGHKLVAIAVLAAAALIVGPASGAVAAGASPTSVQSPASAKKVVPNVVGKTAYAAKAALAKAGLKYRYSTPKGSFVVLSKNWTVIKQSPKPKSKVKAGTKVKLTVVKTSTLGPSSAAAPTTPAAPPAPSLTVAQKQAVIAAKGYLLIGSGFSYQGLIDQLSSAYGNGFSAADATVAVDSLHVDYNAQAVLAAKSYMDIGGFSHASLVQQLSSAYGSKFTPEQAEYATTQVGL